MNEYEQIINSLNSMLTEFSSLDSKDLKENFLLENSDILEMFKKFLVVLLQLYQFKEFGNEHQNAISNKLMNSISILLQNADILKGIPKYDFFITELLDNLDYNESKYAFNLQYNSDHHGIKSALEYSKIRANYLEILDTNNFYQDDSFLGISARKYYANKYEENMLGHSIMYLKKHFLKMDETDIKQIVQLIDNSNIVDHLMQKAHNPKDFYSSNLCFQYTEVILRLKQIFSPEKIFQDKFVQALWNGKISDQKIRQNIIKSLSLSSFISLANTTPHSSELLNIASHLRQVNYSDTAVSSMLETLLDSCTPGFEIALFLSDIGIPNDLTAFMNSEYSKKYPWILQGNFFQSLNKYEIEFNKATNPFLPAEYYIKKLATLQQSQNIDIHFVQNLTILLHSDFYTPQEKVALTEAIKKNKLYSEFITDEKLEFASGDSLDTTHNKILKSYFSGQVIPINIALPIIKEFIEMPHSNDTHNRVLIEACIQSLVNNKLSEKGIDIGISVFFGNGVNEDSQNRGYYDSDYHYIWLDSNLIEKLISSPEQADRVDIFSTIFHEMQHCIQYHNIKTNNIDYQTYCFIKEEILQKYDKNFYSSNYHEIYMESDARREGTLNSLAFLKSLNPQFIRSIRQRSEDSYIKESIYHTIYTAAHKQIQVGNISTDIDISEYLGLLIRNNPQILSEYPILSVEYNLDGSKKDVTTIMQDFERKQLKNNLSGQNFESIYYGLVAKISESSHIEDSSLDNKVASFLQDHSGFITLEDMQLYYKRVSPTLARQTYSRLLSLTRGQRLSPSVVHTTQTSQKGVDYDDNSSR